MNNSTIDLRNIDWNHTGKKYPEILEKIIAFDYNHNVDIAEVN